MAAEKTRIHRTLNIAGITLLCLLMLAGFSVYLAPHVGWRIDDLRSGSMAPNINVGDLVVTRPVRPEAVTVGDVIIFHSPDKANNLISHRVVEVETNPSLSFKTKGDANDAIDPFVTPAGKLVGELAFHVPLLGYPVLLLQTTSGFIVSLLVPGLVIISLCLTNLRVELVKKKGNTLC